MKGLPERLHPSKEKKKKKEIYEQTQTSCADLKALWIRKSAHFYKDPGREYLNVNPER